MKIVIEFDEKFVGSVSDNSDLTELVFPATIRLQIDDESLATYLKQQNQVQNRADMV